MMKMSKGGFDFEKIPSTISGLFKDFMSEMTGKSAEKPFVPPADRFETDFAYVFEVVVPGMRKEDFHIEIKNGKLNISGHRKLSKDENTRNLKIESNYGPFSKEFDLYKNVNDDKIIAKYEAGILVVTLPKFDSDNTKKSVKVD